MHGPTLWSHWCGTFFRSMQLCMKAQGGETWHSSALKPQHMLPKTEPVRASGHSDLDLRTHTRTRKHKDALSEMITQSQTWQKIKCACRNAHVLAGYTAYKSTMTLKLMCRMKVCRHTEKLHCAMTNSSTAFQMHLYTKMFLHWGKGDAYLCHKLMQICL